MRSAPTFACELRRSRLELAAIGVLAAAALAAPWLAPLGAWSRALLSVAAVVATVAALGRGRGRTWSGLALAGGGAATLAAPGRPDWRGTLEHATLLGPLVVLSFRDDQGARVRLPIYPDSTDADSARRLRVLLRHGWRAEPGGTIR